MNKYTHSCSVFKQFVIISTYMLYVPPFSVLSNKWIKGFVLLWQSKLYIHDKALGDCPVPGKENIKKNHSSQNLMKLSFPWNPQLPLIARDSLLGVIQLKCSQPIPNKERAERINSGLFESKKIIFLWSAFLVRNKIKQYRIPIIEPDICRDTFIFYIPDIWNVLL